MFNVSSTHGVKPNSDERLEVGMKSSTPNAVLSSEFIPYRSDIDGLRAVAVLAVILFHLGVATVSGGYVGVDIFFVISGFLITQDILNRHSKGSFSFLEFYIRRVRRLFPALFVVLFLSLGAGLIILPPAELESLAKSTIAAVFFSANIFFYRRDGYFAAGAEETPLLHLWSLGVEEQFYLVWPLVLIAGAMVLGRRGVVVVLVAITGVSLIFSQITLDADPEFSFYMLPARAWQLAAGGLLAVASVNLRSISRSFATVLAALGLVTLFGVFISYSPRTPFPGFSALAPCIGTMLLIVAGFSENPISKALGSSIPVAIGKVSYPLYLVHWPIIVFWTLHTSSKPSTLEILVLFVLMSILAYLIASFVEKPIRTMSATKTRVKAWTAYSAAAIGSTLVIALPILLLQGVPDRGTTPEWVLASAEEARRFQLQPCLVRGTELPTSNECTFGDPAQQRTIFLWGNSHAAHLIPAVRALAEREGMAAVFLTKAGCTPIPEVQLFPLTPMRSGCREFNKKALEAILVSPNVSHVLIAGQWKTELTGQAVASDNLEPVNLERSLQIISQRMDALNSTLNDKNTALIVAGVAPTGNGRSHTCAVRMAFYEEDAAKCLEGAREEAAKWQRELSSLLPPNVLLLDLSHLLCRDQECEHFKNDKYYLLDNSHMSEQTSMKLVPALQAAVKPSL